MFKYILWPSRIIESLFNLIRDLVFKGVPKNTIITEVKSRYTRRAISTIETYINYNRGTKSSATRLKQSGATRPILDVVESSQSSNPRFLRVGYTFEFIDPKRGGYRKAGFYTDVEPGLTKQQLQQKIREEMLAWLQSNYEFRNSRGKRFTPGWRNLEIKSIEGV